MSEDVDGYTYASLSGLQVAADGSTSYDFDGHVHATGLDLTPGTGSGPSPSSSIQWLKQDGGVLAYITEGVVGQASVFSALAQSLTRFNNAELRLTADDSVNDGSVIARASGDNVSQRKLLDWRGRSDFLQLRSPGAGAGVGKLTFFGPYQFRLGGQAIASGAVSTYTVVHNAGLPGVGYYPVILAVVDIGGIATEILVRGPIDGNSFSITAANPHSFTATAVAFDYAVLSPY